MATTQVLEQSWPGLVQRITHAIHERHLNQRAEQIYLHWISRFLLFNESRNPETLGSEEQQRFLNYLSEGMRVSRAKVNQARQALQFFYEDVLGRKACPEEAASV